MRIPGVPYVQGRNDYTDSDGRKYGIAIHNTSNDASAEGEASYATRRTDGISAHLYVDRDSVIQSLDTDDRAGHAGSSNGNQHAVAVEITGVNGKSRQWWLDNVAWAKLGAALAHVVRKYGIAVRRASVSEMRSNPRVKAFYSHDDMRRAWGGTSHTDPGDNFPWDRLFSAVTAALNGKQEDEMELTDSVELFTNYGDVQYSVKAMTVGTILASTNYYVLHTRNKLLAETAALRTQLTAQTATIEALAKALESGGGSVDVAAVKAHIDLRIAEARADARDAVADLGEGGAAQVRAGSE